MTVINPRAFELASEIVYAIVKSTLARAGVLFAEEFKNILQQHGVIGSANTNAAAEIEATLFQAAQLLVQQQIANDIDKYYTFRINPSKLDKKFGKIRDNKLTGRGNVQQTHGNQLTTFSYSGTMGNMYPPFSTPGIDLIRAPQLSVAWHALAMFERFFLEQDGDLLFVFEYDTFVGRLDSFSYSMDANNPWLINYQFQTSMYPNMKWSIMDGWVVKAFEEIRPVTDIVLNVPTLPQLTSIDVFEEVHGA